MTLGAALLAARFLMGTVCEVAAPPRDAEAAFAEAKRIETMLSTWTDDSELARVNRGETQPSPELQTLLDTTLDWSRRTNHAFDPHVRGLIDAWQTRGDGAVPDRAQLDAAKRDTRIEEGAFGKGYALDRMLTRVEASEVMIDFGGQVMVRGAMRVRVADPAQRDHGVLAFTLRDASVSTSSGSEKTFTANGRRFSHILDPRTGEALPPRGSVSVIAHDALTADIVSTALYVMGEDEGLRWANANDVAALFIDPQHNVRRSARAREQLRDLELLDRRFSIKD
ncbi:MAG TPA: FAD:protein FMN transferase [Thermoanaerobaculia bacterium]|nr:FAD:protein FMN transferase [Thermoanaerobaculia bacterium]